MRKKLFYFLELKEKKRQLYKKKIIKYKSKIRKKCIMFREQDKSKK